MPSVSVCIPVFNGLPYVLNTIQSVLSQTCGDWELVVTDNGSTDGSATSIRSELTRLEEPRVRFFTFANATGLPADWNRTVALAEGEFVKVLPCDDVLHPECLAREVATLQESKFAGFVVSSRRIVDSSGRVRMKGRRTRAALVDRSEGRNALLAGGHNTLGEPGCVLVRRALAVELGWFDTRFHYYPDLDFLYRCVLRAPGVRLNETLSDFRIHGASQSTARRNDYIAEYEALLAHHESTLGASRWERAGARVKARVVARARSAFINWILRTEGR